MCFRILESGLDKFFLNLEQRIVLEDLRSDQIRLIFVKEFRGETFKDWFAGLEAHLKQIYDDFESAAAEVEKKIAEAAGIDRNMRYEIRGRMREACATMTTAWKSFVGYHDQLRDQVKRFTKERVLFAQNKDLVNQLIREWNRNAADVRRRKKNLCEMCPAKDCTPTDDEAFACAGSKREIKPEEIVVDAQPTLPKESAVKSSSFKFDPHGF